MERVLTPALFHGRVGAVKAPRGKEMMTLFEKHHPM